MIYRIIDEQGNILCQHKNERYILILANKLLHEDNKYKKLYVYAFKWPLTDYIYRWVIQ